MARRVFLRASHYLIIKHMSKLPLVWRNEKRKVNDLIPYEKNPRQISEKQLEDLKRSLQTFGLVEVPAIGLDNKILAGHQRVKILQLLGKGETLIDVRIPNRPLTKKEHEAYLLASNALGGSWDYSKLKAFDIDLLLKIGFDEQQLSALWDGMLEAEDDGFDPEVEIKKIGKPKSKLGDLYQLGSHRLLVADSTKPENLKRLLGQDRVSMIYSDPVYNLSIRYDKGLGGKQNYGGHVNDHRSDTEYREFLRQSMISALAVTKDDAHIFYWCDQTYIGLVQDLYRERGITNRRVCLWVKGPSNPTPDVSFNKCYEPCVYGTRGRPFLNQGITNLNELLNKQLGSGNRLIDDLLDQLDIWLVKRISGQQNEHATSKPPSLHEKAIRRCTRPGDIILDSFAGSGSTLIAAEQLKRRAYVVELETIYSDLIIRRYEHLSHNKAKKLN